MGDEKVEMEPGVEVGGTSRRRVLANTGVVGVGGAAAAVLAACGTDPNSGFEIPDPPAVTTPNSVATDDADADEANDDEPDDTGGDVEGLVATADVEVGGGVILGDENLVVTQPAEGQWRGFSAACTHQGCTVSSISSGTINCNCHGSQFSIEDGSVVTAADGGDPSQQDPLPAVGVAVEDGQVVRA